MVQTRLGVIGQVFYNGQLHYSKLHLKMQDCKAANMQHCVHIKKCACMLAAYRIIKKSQHFAFFLFPLTFIIL